MTRLDYRRITCPECRGAGAIDTLDDVCAVCQGQGTIAEQCSPVTRETNEIDHRTGRPLVIQLAVGGKLVRIKPKGARRWYTVTVRQIFQQGGFNRAAEVRAERKAAKAGRKKMTK